MVCMQILFWRVFGWRPQQNTQCTIAYHNWSLKNIVSSFHDFQAMRNISVYVMLLEL